MKEVAEKYSLLVQSFISIPVYLYSKENKIQELIAQLMPFMETWTAVQDREALLELSDQEATFLLDALNVLTPLLDFGYKELSTIDTSKITNLSLRQDLEKFLSFSLLMIGKINADKSILEAICQATPIDEESEDYKQFALEYAAMIEAQQPMKKPASRSLRESLAL